MAASRVLWSAILIAVFSIFFVGVYDFLYNYEDNQCAMTYMFEYPTYLQVPIDENVEKQFPKYKLYMYCEGDYCKRSARFKLSGIPVLFIPGSAGRHKQARSLGSVAINMAESLNTKFHFNYFTVDLNEELSGLYGGVLEEQAGFVSECIQVILRLYKENGGGVNQPDSVVLVGHSMGGLIARAVFARPNFDLSWVHTIITQATPHLMPLVAADYMMSDFYKKVNDFWREESNKSLGHVTLVSVGGGQRDLLVNSRLVSVQPFVAKDKGLTTIAPAVPRAHASTDHLCIVWCKQLVLTTKRALFDIVDRKTKQVSKDVEHKMNVFRHHFLHNSGPKHYLTPHMQSQNGLRKFDNSSRWHKINSRKWFYKISKLKNGEFYTLKLPDESEGEKGLVIMSNIQRSDWVFLSRDCTDVRCVEGENISKMTELIPGPEKGGETSVLKLNLTHPHVEHFSHLVLRLTPTQQQVYFCGEFYGVSQRVFKHAVPSLIKSSDGMRGAINTTAAQTLYHSLELQDLDLLWQAYTVDVEPKNCSEGQRTVVRLSVPWSQETVYTIADGAQPAHLKAKLFTSRPVTGEFGHPSIEVFSTPDSAENTCQVELVVSATFKEVIGQIVRHYALHYLPTYMVINVLLALVYQLKGLTDTGACPTFMDSLQAYAKPYRILLPGNLLAVIAQLPMVSEWVLAAGLPASPDPAYVAVQFHYSMILVRIFLFIVATCIVAALALAMCSLISAIAPIFGWFRRLTGASSLSENEDDCDAELVEHQSWSHYCVVSITVAFAFRSCGQLALIISSLWFFTLMCNQQSKVLQEPNNKRLSDLLNLNTTFLLLYLLVVAIQAPALVVWLKNFRYSYLLVPDTTFYPSLMLCIALLFLFQQNLPSKRGKTVLYIGILLTCLVLVVYGLQSLHRVPYILVAIVWVVLVQQRLPS